MTDQKPRYGVMLADLNCPHCEGTGRLLPSRVGGSDDYPVYEASNPLCNCVKARSDEETKAQ